jgi:hypothetical protein
MQAGLLPDESSPRGSKMIASQRGTAGAVGRLAVVSVAAAIVLAAASCSSSSSQKASTGTNAATTSASTNATTATTAAGAHAPVIQPRLFARAPQGATKPDDITLLKGVLYVPYQNNAGKDGSPDGSMSTIVGFDQHTAAVVATYSVLGRCDGLTADVANGRLVATVNEDSNSSLYVITPGKPKPVHYTYSPSPEEKGSDGSNGGTDAISIGANGTIYVSHSNPESKLPPPNNTAAVDVMTLSGTTAKLTPLFGVNDTAQILNPAAGGATSEPLGLTDPDSNRYLADLAGGTLIEVAQADSKLVLATNLGSGKPTLSELNLTNSKEPAGSKMTPQLDDIERIGGAGTLFAVDQGTGNIFAIPTTAADAGTFIVSQPIPAAGDLPNAPGISMVDMHTGVVTRIDRSFGSPKGLLFVAG